jgi:hypothetical protein
MSALNDLFFGIAVLNLPLTVRRMPWITPGHPRQASKML